MIAEAAGFALLAAISPSALLAMAVFLGSDSPRRTAMTYTAGAVIMTVSAAVASLFILRAAGLSLPRNHDPRYGLRLGLGVVALASAGVLARRSARVLARRRSAAPADRREPAEGVMARLVTRATPRAAFLAGLILFAPSATFLAAVQVIATAGTGVLVTVTGLLIVVALSAVAAWLPLLAYLAAPDATTARLKAVNGWLREQGRALAVGALVIAGFALVLSGALGLAGVL
jgi:hypothetical protein